MRISAIFAAALMLPAACGHVDYEAVERGTFTGSVYVMWIDDGSPDKGDGRFLFVPVPGQELTYTRAAKHGGQVIRPAMMYTDGGSIPKIGQVFKGFSPWGYAPAYMVHDWVFVAHHCVEDGKANEAEKVVETIDFPASASLLAETIKTLTLSGKVKKDDVAPWVISSAVAGPISKGLWDKEGACPVPRVSKEDEARAKAALPGGSAKMLRGMMRTLPDGRQVPEKPAQVVAVVSF